jgi:pimeloyl-ACP methyl ester carboxylesterase
LDIEVLLCYSDYKCPHYVLVQSRVEFAKRRKKVGRLCTEIIRRAIRVAICFLLLVTIAGNLTVVTASDDLVSKFVRKQNAADTVIVFVHGLFGDSRATWTSPSGTFWPELLTKDSTFDGADVFLYSYPTDFWATMSIDELAENMRAVLSANGVANYQKIVFLSHSMGGLVTRAYLLKNRNVAERTAFAYFFSTPTTGSQVASIAGAIFSNPQINKLKTLKPDEYLADLLRQWLAAQFRFPSYCAYEKRPTKGAFLVVNMDSAASLCTKALDPIDADHSDIVKPEGENSTSYLVFKAAYADMKIPDLQGQIDQRVSIKIASGLDEINRFPMIQDGKTPPTLLETLLTDKTLQKIFRFLESYTKQEIESVPKTGEALYQFKTDYYAFQAAAASWENNTARKIGTMVEGKLPQAWRIYLEYMILRICGNDQAKIIAQGNFLNYGITWDDAERVFRQLSTDQQFVRETNDLMANLGNAVQSTSKFAITAK